MCDVEQRLCFALAFWNGRDPILKERIFGLTGTEGNHGEDAKEYWWYVDATPTASWLRWRYHYPHDAFPYATLASEARRRTRADREFELADTSIFSEPVVRGVGSGLPLRRARASEPRGGEAPAPPRILPR